MFLTTRAKYSFSALLLLLVMLSGLANGQSIDINAPAPVTASELAGKILARDIGDARFTDHYYAFAANQGDLVVTIESKNLNGDVDVFTATGLKPVLKFTLYAESATPVTKSIFMRNRQDMILRVQARSPNDDEGSYQIKFSGSFEALPAPAVAETATPTEESTTVARTGQKGRRVTSAGARIYEPEPEPTPTEVAEATPDPSPEATPDRTLETPSSTTEKAVEAPKETAPRTSSNRRSTGRRGSRTRPAETARTAEPPPGEQPATTTEAPATEAPSTSSSSRSSSRRGSSRRNPPKPEPEPQPQEEDTGPRLVIETQDGTLINRSMTTVRRVTVENGQVVVVGKDGAVQRVRLTEVVRMTIAPQQ